jgi:hypothetical protein
MAASQRNGPVSSDHGDPMAKTTTTKKKKKKKKK